jgi:hypothetical protein
VTFAIVLDNGDESGFLRQVGEDWLEVEVTIRDMEGQKTIVG